MSSHPYRLTDLESVQAWGRDWLLGGENIYHPSESAVDYPPNAIVLLSPLGLLPLGAAYPIWMLLNIGLAIWHRISRRVSTGRTIRSG